MKHIALLGDSIFDNISYVDPGEQDVPKQLRTLVKDDCKVTNLAVDGDVIRDIVNQLNNLPSDATHLFLSVGGNDALGQISTFHEPIDTIGGALKKMYLIGQDFKKAYSEMLDSVLAHKLPTAVCNIYYPRYHVKSLNRTQGYMSVFANGEEKQEMAMVAETIFNDIIMFEVFMRKLPLIDLRVLCNDDKDFANPIEPSAKGGNKIAGAMHRLISNHELSNLSSTIIC
tara:strand:- start:174 stop:857 length:684 start_codon:yes stop_codon:yes gene_type:complete